MGGAGCRSHTGVVRVWIIQLNVGFCWSAFVIQEFEHVKSQHALASKPRQQLHYCSTVSASLHGFVLFDIRTAHLNRYLIVDKSNKLIDNVIPSFLDKTGF